MASAQNEEDIHHNILQSKEKDEPKPSETDNYQLVDKQEDLETFLHKLEQCQLFAFDCESVKLGRDHKVSVMNVGLEDGSIFLVDIKALGGVNGRLKSILENKFIHKVMFDCRSDADCLFHQHNIKLEGIEDMQIMQYLVQHPEGNPAQKLPSFLFVLEKYLGREKRNSLSAVKSVDHSRWGERPLAKEQLKYASLEISFFLPTMKELQKTCSKGQEEIRRMSDKYAKARRENAEYKVDDPYQRHRYMPLDILKPAYRGDTKCVECGIMLYRSQFSRTQMRRNDQKCVVCKAVKQEIDTQISRERNWERQAEEDIVYCGDCTDYEFTWGY